MGTTAALVEPVGVIAPNNGHYVFAGPAATVTTTVEHPRVSGMASAPLGLAPGSPLQYADVGMCFQPPGGEVTNFYGSNFSVHAFTTTRADYATAATVVLAPGSYQVGMCVRNNGASPIQNNNYVSGFVQVTS